MPKHTITITIDTDSCDPAGVAEEIFTEVNDAVDGDTAALSLLGNAFRHFADSEDEDSDDEDEDSDDNDETPTYSVDDLKKIATHEIVRIATDEDCDVEAEVRLNAAVCLSQNAEALATSE